MRSNAEAPSEVDAAAPTGRALVLPAAILATIVLVALIGLSALSATPPIDPPARALCVECHEGFVPFTLVVEAPTEAPVDEDFPLRVTVTNPGAHSVTAPTAVLAVDDPAGLSVETIGPQVQRREEQGTLGPRGSAAFALAVQAGAREARFVLDGTGGPLDDLSLTVTGPDGGSWSSTTAGTDEAIELGVDDLATGGAGDYRVVVDRTRGLRRVGFTLLLEVGYGGGTAMLVGPDLEEGGTHEFEFTLRASRRGPNGVVLTVSGTCEYTHADGSDEVETFEEEMMLPVLVGDELVYGTRRGGDVTGPWEGALANGRYLGFVSAALLGTSILTSGRFRGLPRRGRLHCTASYLLVPVLLTHWAMLWLGPYGESLGGIATGSAMLASIAMLTVTGARPALLEGRLLGVPNRRLHRLLTYAVVAVLAVHAASLGTDLAFLRGGP